MEGTPPEARPAQCAAPARPPALSPPRTCAADPICCCIASCFSFRSATTARSFFKLRGCFSGGSSPGAGAAARGAGASAAATAAAAGFLPLARLPPSEPALLLLLPCMPLLLVPFMCRSGAVSGALGASAAAAAAACTSRRCGEVSRRCGDACKRIKA